MEKIDWIDLAHPFDIYWRQAHGARKVSILNENQQSITFMVGIRRWIYLSKVKQKESRLLTEICWNCSVFSLFETVQDLDPQIVIHCSHTWKELSALDFLCCHMKQNAWVPLQKRYIHRIAAMIKLATCVKTLIVSSSDFNHCHTDNITLKGVSNTHSIRQFVNAHYQSKLFTI